LHIQRIQLTNFRNFADVEVELGEKRNLVLGANAQGKTNLLEAMHVLGFGRSHRDRKDQNLVRFGETYYRIEGAVEHIGVRTTIEVAYGQERKRIRLNCKEARPATLIGLAPVVLSSPDDIDLIKRSPGYRRAFLDMAISQVSREYLAHYQGYARALAQRNMLLKRVQGGRAAKGETDVWDEALIDLGARIVTGRVAFLAEIRPRVEEDFGLMSGAATALELVYEPRGYALGGSGAEGAGAGGPKQGLRDALRANRQLELVRGFTLFGPHVDDFKFACDGRDIRMFGSEGEQRTGVLALRCAEVELIKAKIGHYPIVLLDDVFAELDERRGQALTSLISGFDQIVLTSSRPGAIGGSDIRKIVVAEGRISYGG
jgi:DNA replication and repair protein RecF